MPFAAIVAVVLLLVVDVFQLALALGAPLGAAAWGGQAVGVLPTRLRIASAVAGLLVYPLIIAIVLASAGLIDAAWLPVQGPVAMWLLTGLFLLGALVNAVSRSRPERVWAPVSLAIAVCCAVVAINA